MLSSILILLTTPEDRLYYLTVEVAKRKYTEVKSLAQGHTAGRRRRWNLN